MPPPTPLVPPAPPVPLVHSVPHFICASATQTLSHFDVQQNGSWLHTAAAQGLQVPLSGVPCEHSECTHAGHGPQSFGHVSHDSPALQNVSPQFPPAPPIPPFPPAPPIPPVPMPHSLQILVASATQFGPQRSLQQLGSRLQILITQGEQSPASGAPSEHVS